MELFSHRSKGSVGACNNFLLDSVPQKLEHLRYSKGLIHYYGCCIIALCNSEIAWSYHMFNVMTHNTYVLQIIQSI